MHGLLAHCRDLSGVGGVERPGIVHRLDAGTSGVMVVAKHDAAHRHLAAQFAARQVDKGYLAVVLGGAPTAGGVIATGYGRHPSDRRRFTGRLPWPASAPPLAPSPPQALRQRAVATAPAAPLLPATGRVRHAVTAWRRMAVREGFTSMSLRIFTGRTHQIRAHLSEQQLPVLCDRVYGPRAALRLPEGAPPLPAARLCTPNVWRWYIRSAASPWCLSPRRRQRWPGGSIGSPQVTLAARSEIS